METSIIIEGLDVARNVFACFLSGRVDGSVDELVLEGAEERFGHGIIATDPGSYQGLAQIEFLEFVGELPRGELSSSVGMENAIVCEDVVSCWPYRGRHRSGR